MAATKVARTFAPLYTGATWLDVWRAMFNMAAQRSNNAPGPPLSNAEVAAFVREWALVSTSSSMLWAQFAARSYGWSPPGVQYLRRDPEQGRAPYPVTADDDIDVVDVWEWARGIAKEMDARREAATSKRPWSGQPPPRISVDRDTFADPVFAGQVRAALKSDGFDAAFKLPVPACRDRATKKMRMPRPPCDKNGRGPRDPATGQYLPCDKPGDCAPVLVDDPLTHGQNQLSTLLLILGAVWMLFGKHRRSSS